MGVMIGELICLAGNPDLPFQKTSSPARISPDACTSSITIHLGERRRPVSVSVLLFGSPRDF
jgi:hypothetical protein